MNAVKAVEDILRPKSPPSSINHCPETNLVENQSHEKRTTLIKMAGTATGSGPTTSSGPATVAATPQQASTVSSVYSSNN